MNVQKRTMEGGRGVLDLAIHSRGCVKPAFNPKGYKVLAISKMQWMHTEKKYVFKAKASSFPSYRTRQMQTCIAD
jgi:hypothetical protein